ncbi:NYN domain-containing protein [Anabaena sp. UHCC 0187]|uniref:NYN domain-containing protein n=1 Tax=Anabaena sp. UHCC 0187 TaxID=2590018 RepID=UPI00144508E0|nr:NYN domain-containing protein [Anabaena sp. UHCC 0187]MTJ14952.1 NYN domain-containing protein [Anabaena sp. UHCC 0187]
MSIHVFFDNSNIWGGAQSVRSLVEPDVPWMALRLYYRNLFDLIENGRDLKTAILAGSVPPSCEELWQYARDRKYNTDLLKRVESDDGRMTEQAVDEVLHLKIANAIIDFYGLESQTLVVVTGDGKTSDFDTGFPIQIERALKAGWEVEVWSWEQTLSRRRYETIQAASNGRMKINILDYHYLSTTFVRGGEYYEKDEMGKKIYFTIPNRIVQPL